jgi:hypothetical protein
LESSWEFFRLCLDTFTNWNSQELLVNEEVEFKVIMHLFLGFLEGSVCCVAFLPKELSSSDEWCRMLELPTNDIGPLI